MYDGVNEVGNEPCDEEWGKNTLQIIDKEYDTYDSGEDQKAAYEFVECDFLF
jgi:hypothetical protein